jgi:hypothetical protein
MLFNRIQLILIEHLNEISFIKKTYSCKKKVSHEQFLLHRCDKSSLSQKKKLAVFYIILDQIINTMILHFVSASAMYYFEEYIKKI